MIHASGAPPIRTRTTGNDNAPASFGRMPWSLLVAFPFIERAAQLS